MKKLIIKGMEIGNYNEVVSLWKNSPGIGVNKTDSKLNFSTFLKKNNGHSFIGIYNGSIIGTILCGNDGRRGYIYHLVVDKNYGRKGIGKELVLKKCFLFSEELL